MGKKNKHSKDQLHLTVSELGSRHVGPDKDLELSIKHRRLKYYSCCLTLNPLVERPLGLCDKDGYCYVFNSSKVIAFLEKFQLHPITGDKINKSDLIDLKFHKNSDDKYHCPVLYKTFNENSKIVANRKTGHVYSYEAVQQLNLKTKNFKDLITDEPFQRDDLVLIQDPEKADSKWDASKFYHVTNRLKIIDDEDGSTIRNLNYELKTSLDAYNKNAADIAKRFTRIVNGESSSSIINPKTQMDRFNTANYSDGNVSRAVTSTIAPAATKTQAAELTEEQIIYPRIKKKGYAQIVTNFGPLNIELYCDRVPKTCHNFLLLARRGYYDNCIFHRLIKNFILQGGDPTGTGSGGDSAWGGTFKDECHGDLKHSGRGVLAMANSGPNTNKSQFYITMKGSWPHLDGKHTVFGRVVGGIETLVKIEQVEVDKKDRPREEIKILQVLRYEDPFEIVEEQIAKERQEKMNTEKLESEEKELEAKLAQGSQPKKKFRSGVGAFIDLKLLHGNSTANSESSESAPVKSQNMTSSKPSSNFGDFSCW